MEGEGSWCRVCCTILGAGLSPQYQQALQQLHRVQGCCLTACLGINAATTQAFCHRQLLWVSVLVCVDAVGTGAVRILTLALSRTNLSFHKEHGGHSIPSPLPCSSTLLWLHHSLWNGQSESSGFKRHRQKAGIQLVLNK